jgi:hypothetical protein
VRRKFVSDGFASAKPSMPETMPPAILAPLGDITRWLLATRTQAVIVGGVAVSLLSRPRFTQDIDALAWVGDESRESLLAAAADFGIVPRIDDPLEFARRTRVLLLRHSATAIDVDVILGGLAFEREVVENGMAVTIGGVAIRLPKVEHLMIMKAIANRPQDQEDVAALREAHPDVDLALW